MFESLVGKKCGCGMLLLLKRPTRLFFPRLRRVKNAQVWCGDNTDHRLILVGDNSNKGRTLLPIYSALKLFTGFASAAFIAV